MITFSIIRGIFKTSKFLSHLYNFITFNLFNKLIYLVYLYKYTYIYRLYVSNTYT